MQKAKVAASKENKVMNPQKKNHMKQLSKIMMGVTLVFLVLNGCSDETPEQIKHIQDSTLEELTFTAKSFQRANGVDSRTALNMKMQNLYGQREIPLALYPAKERKLISSLKKVWKAIRQLSAVVPGL